MERAGVGLVYDERMCAHENLDDPFHPEKPARITSIFKSLESAGIVERCVRVEARDATPAELASVHTQEHILRMCAVSSKKYGKGKRAALGRSYSSIYFNEGSSSSALLAAGSVVEVCLRVARGDLRAGAAVVRPPGHHAEAGAAMGFCLFNNVAVAAHVLVHGNPDIEVRKILIVDWDVHHGNGTQHMFWRDPQVLYFSIHRHDFGEFYPGGGDGNYDKIGEDKGAGFNINVPWPHGGYGDLDYLTVFDNILMPVAREFKPDLVLVSGGFDSAMGDPLGACEVTPAGYSQMTNRLMSLANGRVVLALEGGYNLKSISDSYLACMKVLLGEQPEKTMSTKHHLSSTFPLVQQVRHELQKYWLDLSSKIEAQSMLYNKVEDFPADVANAKLVVQVTDSGTSARLPADWTDSEESVRGQIGELNLLVKTFNKALALDPDNNEFTTGSNAEKVQQTKKYESQEVRTSLEDVQDGYKGDASSSGCLEVRGPLTSEPQFSPQGPEEAYHAAMIGNLQESILNDKQRHGVTLSENRLQDGERAEGVISSPDHKSAETTYVWYACFASNMWTARFMCYIKGGQAEGMAKGCVGSRNPAPPVASRWIRVPYSLFFGHSDSRVWGGGSVAFLDPVSHGGAPTTHMRLYKITLQQFCDVLTQENGGDPNNSQLMIDWDHVNKLRSGQSARSHSTFDFLEDNWYGTVKYLGDEDGLPMLTITCSLKDMQKFREGKLQMTSPSQSYQTAILRGLMEQAGSSEEECRAYIASKSKGLSGDTKDEKI